MNFKTSFQHELKNLPGEIAHLEMFPLRPLTSESLPKATDYRLSGVMALLYPHESSFRMILTERQTYDGKHSGQMSFPGGKLEPYETTSLQAALRETFEEIGIDPDTIEVVGQLSDVFIPVSNFLVHPFVGFLEKEPTYKLDVREVKNVITFEISELLKTENRIETIIELGNGATMKGVPAFFLGERVVWGATALMLNEIRFILQRF